ncbi:hypothetical protein ACYSNR_14440 [Enterococcus sp. LJL128]|uniref:hypothetical protein n=1 Tax=Enterococcus sp. LJL51 TaxID=3416656 RepID=UPI003CE939EE
MEKLIIKEGELVQATALAESAKADIKHALSAAKSLAGSTTSWQGEAKNTYAMYLDILSQNHEEVAEMIQDFHSALKKLDEDCKVFDSGDMAEIRGI